MVNSKELDRRNKDTILFGPIPKDVYPLYAREQIRQKFSPDSKNRTEREKMWKNFEGLCAAISASEDTDILQTIKNYIKGLNVFARTQLENCPPGGLGIHLKEAGNFAKNLLFDSRGRSRFEKIISDHKARLLVEVIAPMHDMLKLLGLKDAQVIPDHEIMTAVLIRKTFVGKQITLNEKNYTFNQDDVDFIAGVIGDHENINKEEGRRDFIKGTEIERAKALFFVVDALTGVIVPGENGDFKIDIVQLQKRFTNLYFRHIDLVRGKIFRPQWGAHTINDLLFTIAVLQQHGLTIAESEGKKISQILKESALEAIADALQANDLRESPKFTPDQLDEINKAKSLL